MYCAAATCFVFLLARCVFKQRPIYMHSQVLLSDCKTEYNEGIILDKFILNSIMSKWLKIYQLLN